MNETLAVVGILVGAFGAAVSYGLLRWCAVADRAARLWQAWGGTKPSAFIGQEQLREALNRQRAQGAV